MTSKQSEKSRSLVESVGSLSVLVLVVASPNIVSHVEMIKRSNTRPRTPILIDRCKLVPDAGVKFKTSLLISSQQIRLSRNLLDNRLEDKKEHDRHAHEMYLSVISGKHFQYLLCLFARHIKGDR